MSIPINRPDAVHVSPGSWPVMDEEQAGYEMQQPNQPVTRSERIFEEFANGRYECAICSDEISAQAKCWDCSTCYHVYHFNCIVTWSERYASKPYWPCPTCKRSIPQEQLNTASCWCGKQNHSALELIGNTCGSMCSRLNRCVARSCVTACQKPCHPGPCDPVECLSFCPSKLSAVTKPTVDSRDETGDVSRGGRSEGDRSRGGRRGRGLWPSSAYQQESSAHQPANRTTYPNNGGGANPSEPNGGDTGFHIFNMIMSALFLAVINGFLVNWAVNRSKWWTRPLSYIYFTEHMLGHDNRGALAAFILNILIGALFVGGLIGSLKTLLTRRFGLDRREHTFRRLFISAVLLILAAGLTFGFNLVLTFLPEQMWFDQFHHSCDGFDTRVSFDREECRGRSGCFYTPETNFALIASGGSSGLHHITKRNIDKFDIIKSTDYSLATNAPFYQYYRVRGILAPSPKTTDASGPISIDFDLANYAWRLYDMALSSNSTQAQLTTLSPSTVTPNLIKEGTWTSTTRSQPHAVFTNISLSIPNLYFYTHDCHYQPFMKVYRTTNQTDLAIHQQARIEWSPSNEDNVVMRTASFGHGPHGLQICARRGYYDVGSPKGEGEVDGNTQMRKGMGEDVIVPLGLLAVLRRDMFETGKMGDQCSFANK